MNLVPIKVKIGLRPNGHADHPDWRVLQPTLGADPETHTFYGWFYDKTSGHGEHTVDSPIGFQYGVKLVTPALAAAALAQWPTLITVLNEAELADFWDNKAHAHLEDTRTDRDTLEGLRAEKALRVDASLPTADVDRKIAAALDPDDPKPGVRRNPMVRWSTAKAKLDVKIVASIGP